MADALSPLERWRGGDCAGAIVRGPASRADEALRTGVPIGGAAVAPPGACQKQAAVALPDCDGGAAWSAITAHMRGVLPGHVVDGAVRFLRTHVGDPELRRLDGGSVDSESPGPCYLCASAWKTVGVPVWLRAYTGNLPVVVHARLQELVYRLCTPRGDCGGGGAHDHRRLARVGRGAYIQCAHGGGKLCINPDHLLTTERRAALYARMSCTQGATKRARTAARSEWGVSEKCAGRARALSDAGAAAAEAGAGAGADGRVDCAVPTRRTPLPRHPPPPSPSVVSSGSSVCSAWSTASSAAWSVQSDELSVNGRWSASSVMDALADGAGCARGTLGEYARRPWDERAVLYYYWPPSSLVFLP